MKFPIPPKAKEVHFKTMNEIYPYREFLLLKFNIDSNECTLCNDGIETQEHLFFSCNISELFWENFQKWISDHNMHLSRLTYNNVQFGVILEDPKLEFLFNNLLILGKHYIHKCKFMKTNPQFLFFLKELSILFNVLKGIESKSAQCL